MKKLPGNLPVVFFRICGQSPTASEEHKQYVKHNPAFVISWYEAATWGLLTEQPSTTPWASET